MKQNRVITRLIISIFVSLSIVSCANGVQEKTNTKEVLVVSHRGDWRNFPENSLEAIRSCIDMGVDIVEIDIARTKDGHLILMHDKSVDRTTNAKGKVADFTLEEIKALNLRNGTGRVTTNFTVPTLKEAMTLVKGKIMVNLDKADSFFDDVYHILEQTGTVDQAVIKSPKPYSELRKAFGPNLDKMIFMPKIRLTDTLKYEDIAELLDKEYSMYEISFGEEHKELMNKITSRLEGTKSKIWINTLWESQNAGMCDDYAIKNPDANWGYLIDSCGATVLQTDRPASMIKYLELKGYRK